MDSILNIENLIKDISSQIYDCRFEGNTMYEDSNSIRHTYNISKESVSINIMSSLNISISISSIKSCNFGIDSDLLELLDMDQWECYIKYIEHHYIANDSRLISEICPDKNCVKVEHEIKVDNFKLTDTNTLLHNIRDNACTSIVYSTFKNFYPICNPISTNVRTTLLYDDELKSRFTLSNMQTIINYRNLNR